MVMDDLYRVTYTYADGTVEGHTVQAKDEVYAIDIAQPNRAGEEISDIKVEAI